MWFARTLLQTSIAFWRRSVGADQPAQATHPPPTASFRIAWNVGLATRNVAKATSKIASSRRVFFRDSPLVRHQHSRRWRSGCCRRSTGTAAPKLCSYVLAPKMASHETFRIPQPYRTRPADSMNDQCSLITRQVSKKLGKRRIKNPSRVGGGDHRWRPEC